VPAWRASNLLNSLLAAKLQPMAWSHRPFMSNSPWRLDLDSEEKTPIPMVRLTISLNPITTMARMIESTCLDDLK